MRLEGSLATLPMTKPRSPRLLETDAASPTRLEALKTLTVVLSGVTALGSYGAQVAAGGRAARAELSAW